MGRYVELNIATPNKTELLLVLERPEIPLHTNGSETDSRDYVKKREVSGGTSSDGGGAAAIPSLASKKTCRKFGISCWQYSWYRLGIGEATIRRLADIVLELAPAPAY